MTIPAPTDPVPGYPLICRIDVRVGPNTTFWSRIRKAYLPTFCGHAFWVCGTDKIPDPSPHLTPMVPLDRKLILHYLPNFVRLTPAQRRYIHRRFLLQIPSDDSVNKPILHSLVNAGVINRARITTLGWNSYYLS